MCLDLGTGNITEYLNQEAIKSALNFPSSYQFQHINMDLNGRYDASRSVFRNMAPTISFILDAHLSPGLGDVRLLVLQGNNDVVCNTPGNAWRYDNLLWSGHADYRILKFEELDEEKYATTGFWKATKDGRLAFVAVDKAGHTVPGDKKEGAYRILQNWIEGGWHM